MLRMEFTQKDKEHNMYHWHPLFDKVEDVVNIGDELEVKVTEIDRQGRVNLSHKVLL